MAVREYFILHKSQAETASGPFTSISGYPQQHFLGNFDKARFYLAVSAISGSGATLTAWVEEYDLLTDLWVASMTGVAGPLAAAPAMPATGVAQQNTTGQVYAVAITGGTVTAVTVNGVQVGSGGGTYYVPAWGAISVTYTGSPAWTWAMAGTAAWPAQTAITASGANGSSGAAGNNALTVDISPLMAQSYRVNWTLAGTTPSATFTVGAWCGSAESVPS